MKPLGIKSYGSIPHLSTSKLGVGDHQCHIGQEIICTQKLRDKNDIVIVQEKLDGGNVGVCKVNGEILAITRSGYLAITSPYSTHWAYSEWVERNTKRFDELLNEGERICGEWLLHAVGTRYDLPHEPFVAFDIMVGGTRESYFTASKRLLAYGFVMPHIVSIGQPVPVGDAMKWLGGGGHGAIDGVEGLIYRVERKGKVDFITKHVRSDKDNGKYFPEKTGGELILNSYI